MVAEPAATPNTKPVVFTDAIDAALELQVPPAVPSLNVTPLPWQTEDAPLTVPGLGVVITVIALVVMAVPQLLVTA